MSGEHDEIGTIAAHDVFDDADGVAGLADELRVHLWQVFGGEKLPTLYPTAIATEEVSK